MASLLRATLDEHEVRLRVEDDEFSQEDGVELDDEDIDLDADDVDYDPEEDPDTDPPASGDSV